MISGGTPQGGTKGDEDKECTMYFIAIIDCLQNYDIQKSLETAGKTASGNVMRLGVALRGERHTVTCPRCKACSQYDPDVDCMLATGMFELTCPECRRPFDWIPSKLATANTDVSSEPPGYYRQRWLRFMSQRVLGLGPEARKRPSVDKKPSKKPSFLQSLSCICSVCNEDPYQPEPSPQSSNGSPVSVAASGDKMSEGSYPAETNMAGSVVSQETVDVDTSDDEGEQEGLGSTDSFFNGVAEKMSREAATGLGPMQTRQDARDS